MKKIKKAVAVTGKYTDRNGNEKNQYHTCGALFQRDDGSLCMKLDALPLGDFNGWVSFYDIEENRKENNQQGMAQARQAAEPSFDDLEDLPF